MKKGFTVVELIASFTLAIIIAVLMFQVVLVLKGIFTNSGLKTQLLNKQALISDNIYKKIKSLSGGEKVRLKLFCLTQQSYNFLLLDEPTNHIDIDTREMLEESLKEFTGTILFVSHDRYFINKIATSIIEIKNKNITRYIGNYDDYREKINKI